MGEARINPVFDADLGWDVIWNGDTELPSAHGTPFGRAGVGVEYDDGCRNRIALASMLQFDLYETLIGGRIRIDRETNNDNLVVAHVGLGLRLEHDASYRFSPSNHEVYPPYYDTVGLLGGGYLFPTGDSWPAVYIGPGFDVGFHGDGSVSFSLSAKFVSSGV